MGGSSGRGRVGGRAGGTRGRAWTEQAWRIAHVALGSQGGNDKTVRRGRPLSCQGRFPLLVGSVCPSAEVLPDCDASKLPRLCPGTSP